MLLLCEKHVVSSKLLLFFLLYRNFKVVNLTTTITSSEVLKIITLFDIKLLFNKYYSNYLPQVLVQGPLLLLISIKLMPHAAGLLGHYGAVWECRDTPDICQI